METKAGGCHCKAVRYEVTLDTAQPVIECNCSHCLPKGFLLTFVPKSAVTILSGEDVLTEYLFNTKKIQHLFCSTCGIQSFGFGIGPDGVETCAVNMRTLDDINLESLTRIPYDGKNS